VIAERDRERERERDRERQRKRIILGAEQQITKAEVPLRFPQLLTLALL
jgi:hypothetical protein